MNIDSIIEAARKEGIPAVLKTFTVKELRHTYAAAYEGEYSMDGDLGEDLAWSLPKAQLIEDITFFLEAQI